jgi:predicted TIM-barrel fold metal-dependent hydrolase
MDLKIPVAVQLQPGKIANLARLAKRFPDATILVDHLAGVGTVRDATTQEQADLLSLADLPTVHLKFSTMNLRPAAGLGTAGSLLRSIIDRFGAGRLLWGSNFPVSQGSDRPYADLLDEARRVLGEVATEDEQALILGENAARIYGR